MLDQEKMTIITYIEKCGEGIILLKTIYVILRTTLDIRLYLITRSCMMRQQAVVFEGTFSLNSNSNYTSMIPLDGLILSRAVNNYCMTYQKRSLIEMTVHSFHERFDNKTYGNVHTYYTK